MPNSAKVVFQTSAKTHLWDLHMVFLGCFGFTVT